MRKKIWVRSLFVYGVSIYGLIVVINPFEAGVRLYLLSAHVRVHEIVASKELVDFQHGINGQEPGK